MKLTPQQKVLLTTMLIIIGIMVASIVWPAGPTCGEEGLPPCPTPAPTQTPAPTTPPQVVIEIASSDTKEDWLDAVAAQFNAEGHTIAAGNTIVVEPMHGTSGGTQQAILDGNLRPAVWSPGDYSWVEGLNKTWRDRTNQPLIRADCSPTILAPVGFAMWRPMAEALGWPDTRIGWRDLTNLMAAPDGWASMEHPEWGAFKFGHTHPAYSNVGMLMLTSLAYLTTGQTEGLTSDAVYSDEVAAAFRQVELNTYHYGIRSRDLLSLMVTRGPAYLHAVTTSEAETLKTNAEQGANMHSPLVFIFPSDGTFWGEHPYCVLDADWVSAEQREAAAIFLDYLLDPVQQEAAIVYRLRPLDQSIPLAAPIALENGTNQHITTAEVPELTPPSSDVANAVIDVFRQTKKKAAVVLVLDTSGSMVGEPIQNAVTSANNFIGRLDRGDQVYVLGFGTIPYPIGEGGLVAEVSETLTATLNGVYAEGNTALYDAVCQATAQVETMRAGHEANNDPHLYGIVVLSDGADTGSTNSENQMFNCLPSGESVEGVRVYTIAYGVDANTDVLTRIANRTNGSFFAGTYAADIERIYNQISAEQ